MKSVKKYKLYGLYSHNEPNRIRYIGICSGYISGRLSGHIRESRLVKEGKNRATMKHNWIIKNDFKIGQVLLGEFDTKKEVLDAEIGFIKMFKAMGEKLVNSTIGGEGAFGHVVKDSVKEEISLMKSKTIYVYDYKTGEFIMSYVGVKRLLRDPAFAHKNFSGNCISKILTKNSNGKKLNSHKGLYFSYEKKFEPRLKKLRDYPMTLMAIRQGGSVKEYRSSRTAAKDVGISRSSIDRALKNKNGFINGMQFKYI